jgi:N-acetylglucosaminyldiphosphoundecaprenol N-acetyl-beta-D-mannosaminyltransferase
MRRTVDILGVPIDYVTMKQATDKVVKFLGEEECKAVYTPNPEIVMAATQDAGLMKALREAAMVVPDGIGVVLGSRLLQGDHLPERVAGYDLVQNVFRQIANTEYKVFFFGGAPGVAEQAAQAMGKKYKGLKIVGTRNGYFTEEQEEEIIAQIHDANPDLLLIGLGAPKQEKWIYKYRNVLGSRVCIGVGGSFDVMAGKVKRAPVIFQKMGLEWFYGLITQPTRAKRMMQLPIFVWQVFTVSRKRK